MYCQIEDREKNSDNYVLTKVDPSMTEDECFDLLANPRQTQRTLGFHLKKVKDLENNGQPDRSRTPEAKEKRHSLFSGSHHLEREVMRNKGFWVGKPQTSARLTYKLRERYMIQIPVKTRKETGFFHASNAVKVEESMESTKSVLSNRIPTGCQCDTYGQHKSRPSVWDFPFSDQRDMIRQHEMNKVLKPYKSEILNRNYTKKKPVKLIEKQFGMKKKFPIYNISNL